MSAKMPLSTRLYHRLLSYLHYMKQLPPGSMETISSTVIASALGVNDVQVRKDLAVVSNRGRPKIGYITQELIADMEHFLGHDSRTDAVLVGVGNLGKALLSYENFAQYGLHIVAAFDSNPVRTGQKVGRIPILDAAKIAGFCAENHIRVGIIAVPAYYAQSVCDRFVSGGVRAVWNFAPVNLVTPETVIVRNEDMAVSLAILTKQLDENIALYG